MANIIEYGAQYINLDYLLRAYPDGKNMVLEMVNGDTFHLSRDFSYLLSGRVNVVQAFPVNDLYADYRDVNGRHKEKVLFMGVCANGEVRPMGGLRDHETYFMDDTKTYDGLSDTKTDEDGNDIST